MLLEEQITDIFCIVDEFMLEFKKRVHKFSLGNVAKRQPKLNQSEA